MPSRMAVWIGLRMLRPKPFCCGRSRELLRSGLIASLEEANASIERGEGRVITKVSMQALAEEATKQRLRARLAADQFLGT